MNDAGAEQCLIDIVWIDEGHLVYSGVSRR